MTNEVPAGWYPTPDGKQRYWDGERWTNLPFDDSFAKNSDAVSTTGVTPRKSRRKLLIGLSIGVIALLAIAGGLLGLKTSADAQAAADVQAAQLAEEAAAQAAQDEKDTAERADRVLAVTDIETSVRTMAEEHVTSGILDGPVIDVQCSPVGGGSTDDLTEQTTVFECFVANKDNGDGTMMGYYYNATMNWTTGSYTYGQGRP